MNGGSRECGQSHRYDVHFKIKLQDLSTLLNRYHFLDISQVVNSYGDMKAKHLNLETEWVKWTEQI